MSDFLTNLAARSLGLTKTVRPRMVSMFEPLRAPFGPTDGPGFGSEMIDETLPDGAGVGLKAEIHAVASGMGGSRGHLARQLVPGIRSGDTGARPGVSLESQESDLSVAHGIVQPAPSQAAARPETVHSVRANTSMAGNRLGTAGHLSVSRPPRESVNDPRASTPRLDNEMSMVSRLSALSSDARLISSSPPDVVEPGVAPHAAASPLVTGGALRPSTESKILAAESHLREDPAIQRRFSATLFGKESDAVPESSPSGARHAHLPTRRSRSKASSPGVRQDTAETEPTIQVTIGRIEVRAKLAAPEPSKKRPGQPVMSLDEYLRQRANRGRQ
jgi:hypothetical protein